MNAAGAAGALTIEAAWGDRQDNLAQRDLSVRELDHVPQNIGRLSAPDYEQPLVVPQFKHL